MRTKFKPNKSAAKRFKVTKTGKLKRHHGFTSHLMSARNANTRRSLRKPEIVNESHAKRLRKIMGISGKGPGKLMHAAQKAAHLKNLEAAEAASLTTTTASA